MKGSSSCSTMSSIEESEIRPPVPPLSIVSAASSGVSAMPSRLEKDALTTAAATLPRAMAVKAMEDCTVEGSSVRNSRSEEHTSELQSLMRISYAVFCLKKKQQYQHTQ